MLSLFFFPFSRESLRNAMPAFLIVVAVGIFWTFGYNGIWHRLQIDIEGKITARQDLPQTVYTHGPTTLYTLQQGDGSVHEYTATLVDPSLPRTLPVGAYVTKRKGEVTYFLNGKPVDDFPLTAYIVLLGVGIVCLIAAGVPLVRAQWHQLLFKAHR